jgi:hypothetical protein
MSLRAAIVIFGSVGILLPVIVMSIDRLSLHGWFPWWLVFVWPTSYMVLSWDAHGIMIISTVINALIYILTGLLLRRWIRAALTPSK